MQLITGKQKEEYIEKYSFQSFFSFDISPFVQVCEFEKGEYIFQESSLPESLYYMVEGKAKLYVTHKNGKVSLINFITSPSFMGEVELLNAQKYTKGIQTVTKTICFSLPYYDCKQRLLTDSVFLRQLCLFLGNKMTQTTNRFSQTQAYPLENRLAAFILMSSDGNFYKEKHTEISEYLGVSYRHLLHTFAHFCQLNMIKKSNKGYEIIDRVKLQELAREV
ncbi:transcriptional regulator YeiL [Ureibacillus sp. Re31]|uniref:Transcriptional regulator YeiL n=1 Tax=Ureibacillus galli TaxID=2762222 RepID=A0ABR8XG87_9BACL|nr:transcriptional regulator YeiL [Ureibacillus galli]MBD8028233.1 transcriptional regulator YeiL [Ureibacillus galli]